VSYFVWRPDFLRILRKKSLLEAFVIIASMWACQLISCERVMPRSLKCCTLSTLTGLSVEQSDNSWGGRLCQRSQDHLLSLCKVYVHFVWGDPLWSESCQIYNLGAWQTKTTNTGDNAYMQDISTLICEVLCTVSGVNYQTAETASKSIHNWRRYPSSNYCNIDENMRFILALWYGAICRRGVWKNCVDEYLGFRP